MHNRPIIIASVPRSGSSLIAKIFHAHGVWVGRHRDKTTMANTPEPYPSFENIDLDGWFKHQRRPLIDLVRKLVPAGQRWLYKCSPIKARAFLLALAPLKPICVRVSRDMDSILQSSGPGLERQRRSQAQVLRTMSGPVVDADAVMDRDFTSLEEAFDACGLDFNADMAEAQIQDGLWHHRRTNAC